MIRDAITKVIKGESLTEKEAVVVMREIMEGEVSPAQFGTFITALRCKGESESEITGMVKTMRAKAIPVSVDLPVVDTCGTGGDNSSTFNISTATAIVAASAGLNVAKHGNRAVSSNCGSADVLEALGIKIELTAEEVRGFIKETGFGFIYAPFFHPAMKFAATLRREMGIRTVFNILGPMTNPAGAGAQVIGVPEASLVDKIASILKRLGCTHALVVHGYDGLDEITITGKTKICELKDGTLSSYEITPEDIGIKRSNIERIKSNSLKQNADMLTSAISGEKGAHRDAVIANTAAVLLAGDKAETLGEGAEIARHAIDSGLAAEKLNQVIDYSRSF